MKKKLTVFLLLSVLMLMLACSPEDLGFYTRNPDYDQMIQQTFDKLNTTEKSESVLTVVPQEPEDTPQPAATRQPAATIQPTATQENPPHTYSVETTNIGTCICPVRAGETVITLVFNGGNLEMPNTMGNPSIFQNVGENRYEFRYITEKSTGPEELMKVITIFDWGYKEEFYIDNSSKLCCVYDYLRLDK